MVLVSLDKKSQLLAHLSRSGHFGINVLSHEQSHLAIRFAKKGVDSFSDLAWHEETGCPRFEGAAVWLGCRVANLVEGGDHNVVLGDVMRIEVSEALPLTYHARSFGTHAPQEAQAADRSHR
jgi:flavin reductase (DIM6/NTAB) family NADH-FMN oxidoreductase RutF